MGGLLHFTKPMAIPEKGIARADEDFAAPAVPWVATLLSLASVSGGARAAFARFRPRNGRMSRISGAVV